MRNQMAFADPNDWGTVAWAAEAIGVSQRSVRRWIADGTLNGYKARCGSLENGRRHVMLAVSEVLRFAEAYRLVNPGA